MTATLGSHQETLNFIVMTYFRAAIVALSFLVWGSCKQLAPDPKLALQVTNKGPENIDFLTVSTTNGQGRTASSSIPKEATVSVELGFSQVNKTDGSYQLRYQFSNSADTLVKDFGYYTNGYPLEKTLIINVYTDSISVDIIPRGSY